MDYVLSSSGPDGLPDLFTIYDAPRRYGSCGPADTRVLAVGTRGGGVSVVTPTGNAAETSRRALLKISEATILTTVDGLDLRGHAKISAVVGIPLRNLQQRRDVVDLRGDGADRRGDRAAGVARDGAIGEGHRRAG